MAPRATKYRAVDVSPLAFSLPRTPKVALKRILGGGVKEAPRAEKGLFRGCGDEEGRKVDRDCPGLFFTSFNGLQSSLTRQQGTESDNQLFYEGTRCKGKNIHVYPDHCRVIASNLVGWARRGADDDWNYVHLYGHGLVRGAHSDCPNSGCNRNLYRVRRQ